MQVSKGSLTQNKNIFINFFPARFVWYILKMTDDVQLKVVFQGTTQQPKGVHIEQSGPELFHLQERNDWDEDCLLIKPTNLKNPGNSSALTIHEALMNIRNNPRLTMIQLPVTRNLQDTDILWMAWKTSMLETIGNIFEEYANYIYTQKCDIVDDTPSAQLQNYRLQLQTTSGMWREHLHFLNEQKLQLATVLHQKETEMTASEAALTAKYAELTNITVDNTRPNCVALCRVLINAVQSLRLTQEERRNFIHTRYKDDYKSHTDLLRSLTRTLHQFIQGLTRDIDDIYKRATTARETIEASISAKKINWVGICQDLQKRYQTLVHTPLRGLMVCIQENQDMNQPYNSNPIVQTIAANVLDDGNDVFCIRRCEIAMAELISLKTYITHLSNVSMISSSAAASEEDIFDDEMMQKAKRDREEELRRADIEHEKRITALESEQVILQRALVQAKETMNQLQLKSEQVKQQVSQDWQNFNPADNKQTVAITRLAQNRQVVLREEMVKTSTLIQEINNDIIQLRSQFSYKDRLLQLTRYLQVTQATYELCRRMRGQFEVATHSEEMMRKVIQDQYVDSARTFHDITTSIIQKAIAKTKAHYSILTIRLKTMDDKIAETTRRIATLNSARVEQEQRIDGPELFIYTALEEFVSISNQYQDLQDSHVKTMLMADTSTEAINVLTELSNMFQNVHD